MSRSCRHHLEFGSGLALNAAVIPSLDRFVDDHDGEHDDARHDRGDLLGDVVELQPGVAIVANSTWAALKARRKLKVEWNESGAAKDDWAATSAQSLKLAESEGAEIIAERGEIANTFTEAAHQLNSVYQYAFVSHAQLEPQVCVARMTAEGGCELWPPSQTPQRAQKNVANVLKLDEVKVTIHPFGLAVDSVAAS